MGAPGQHGSWIGRHKLLTVALVVIGLLVLGGVATAGVVIANRGDSQNKTNTAAGSPKPTPASASPAPSPQPSAGESSDTESPEHTAACAKAAAPNRKAVDLVRGLSTKSVTNGAAIAAIPPIQGELSAAADTANGPLQRDLREYAAALGALRTALMQGRDTNTAVAKVLIYSILLKAECGY